MTTKEEPNKCESCGGTGYIFSSNFTADDGTPEEIPCPECKPKEEPKEKWEERFMELLEGFGTGYYYEQEGWTTEHDEMRPKAEKEIFAFVSSLLQSELKKQKEELTHCQKLVENDTAICGCRLDCHLHDWRQRDALVKQKEEILKLLEGERMIEVNESEWKQRYMEIIGFNSALNLIKSKINSLI